MSIILGQDYGILLIKELSDIEKEAFFLQNKANFLFDNDDINQIKTVLESVSAKVNQLIRLFTILFTSENYSNLKKRIDTNENREFTILETMALEHLKEIPEIEEIGKIGREIEELINKEDFLKIFDKYLNF